ncbi:MAG: sigma-54 dependent transcriptional regulator [Halopseudomonas sp.]
MQLPRLCLIEDDPIMGESLYDRFILEGFEIDWHQSAAAAIDDLVQSHYSLVISDIRLPDMSGEELFDSLQASNTLLPPFIFITGYGSIEKAVSLIKHGAADYITKPFDLDLLVEKVQTLSQNPVPLTNQADQSILGISLPMRRIEASIPRISQHAASVLITGETGVGKEHVARLLHDSCAEVKGQPFIAVNCGAFSPTLLESELFGHEKGAFTGAMKAKKGVFEQADGGTLFLDEVGEMPLNMQVHLLRILQEKKVTRLGGERDYSVNVRLIFATNRDLKKMVENGQFREDLFYRINVIHLHIPPLKERTEDILWFAELFLKQCVNTQDGGPRSLDSSAKRALTEQSWPGNLRELKHCLERACIMSSQQVLSTAQLFSFATTLDEVAAHSEHTDEALQEYIKHCERDYIVSALAQHDWHIVETANCLGISRKNLWEKMKKHGISEANDA